MYENVKKWVSRISSYRTTRININRININPNDYSNPVIDYYNPVIDYYNLVIDYYNPLLRFEPCLNQLGLILIAFDEGERFLTSWVSCKR